MSVQQQHHTRNGVNDDIGNRRNTTDVINSDVNGHRYRHSHGNHKKKRQITFGPYIIGSSLGEGEFGKVKLGWTKPDSTDNNEIPRQVAIKLIRRDNIRGNREKEIKIYREINALKYLNHPNIIRLEEILQNSKYIGIVLEYASGGEFYKFIQRKRRLKEHNACKLFSQLISGVDYMHHKGLVHRDLKLENLLLDKNENLIITDFGFVNEFSTRNNLMQTSCGSPCYAAPELVISMQPYQGTKADIWSCGIILFAMLAGYLPWDDDSSNPNGDDISKLYHYITKTSLKFPDYINPLPRDLLRRILVSNPEKRYDTQKIKNHQWLSAYSVFLNISPSEWDKVDILTPKNTDTNLIKSINHHTDNPNKPLRKTMINVSSKEIRSEESIVKEAESRNPLTLDKRKSDSDVNNTLKIDESISESTKIPNEVTMADEDDNKKESKLRHASITGNKKHNKPRPTTLHITINPSLEPTTTTSKISKSEKSPDEFKSYPTTYSKKSLNKYEPVPSVNSTKNIDLTGSFIKNDDERLIQKPLVSKAVGTKNSTLQNTMKNKTVVNKNIESTVDRKRFSFLSLYSSFNSTKSTLNINNNDMKSANSSTDESGRRKISNSKPHKNSNSSNEELSKSKISNPKSHSKSNSSRSSNVYITAPSSMNTLSNKGLTGISSQRESSIVSEKSGTYDNKKNNASNGTNKEQRRRSTASRVLDYFKRRSTML